MKTADKQFDAWLIKAIGIQDAEIFQKGTLVREVVIKYATERESKYKELVEVYRKLDILHSKEEDGFTIWNDGWQRKEVKLRQQITALEKELGLNKE